MWLMITCVTANAVEIRNTENYCATPGANPKILKVQQRNRVCFEPVSMKRKRTQQANGRRYITSPPIVMI